MIEEQDSVSEAKEVRREGVDWAKSLDHRTQLFFSLVESLAKRLISEKREVVELLSWARKPSLRLGKIEEKSCLFSLDINGVSSYSV